MNISSKAFVEGFITKVAEEYRRRVDVFGIRNGKIVGGYYPSGSFGVVGGGIEPGEDVLQAAAREFKEESGYSLVNPRLISMPPLKVKWTADEKRTLNRADNFVGSKTYFVVGDIKGDKQDKLIEPASWLQDLGLHKLDEVRQSLSKDTTDPRSMARLTALNRITRGSNA